MVEADALLSLAIVAGGLLLLAGGGAVLVMRPRLLVDMDHELGSIVQVTVDFIHGRWGERWAVRFVRSMGVFIVTLSLGGAAAVLLL